MPWPRWREGRCTFGDKCTYAHGEAELRALPSEGSALDHPGPPHLPKLWGPCSALHLVMRSMEIA